MGTGVTPPGINNYIIINILQYNIDLPSAATGGTSGKSSGTPSASGVALDEHVQGGTGGNYI